MYVSDKRLGDITIRQTLRDLAEAFAKVLQKTTKRQPEERHVIIKDYVYCSGDEQTHNERHQVTN